MVSGSSSNPQNQSYSYNHCWCYSTRSLWVSITDSTWISCQFTTVLSSPIPHQLFPFYPPLFGYGFVGNVGGFGSNSGSQSSNMNGTRNFSGAGLKGTNTYRNNSGFNGKSFQSGNFRKNGNSGWFGNTDTRLNVVIECQIYGKRWYTAANCYQRNNNADTTGFLVRWKISGKRQHSALKCYHRRNYAYEGHLPALSMTA